jgi:hypothetical protein
MWMPHFDQRALGRANHAGPAFALFRRFTRSRATLRFRRRNDRPLGLKPAARATGAALDNRPIAKSSTGLCYCATSPLSVVREL